MRKSDYEQDYNDLLVLDYNNYYIKKDANASNFLIIKNKNLPSLLI
jgi:hypothetical protein